MLKKKKYFGIDVFEKSDYCMIHDGHRIYGHLFDVII